ncbi:MAG: shikimate kinase [Clostridiales bacterium]|nr:shikimate kinase [Clostridiales bacterium]
MKSNIILIGMAGSGKSTVGVLAAKFLAYDFVDTDLVLQRQEGKILQAIIDNYGLDYFKFAEERALLGLKLHSDENPDIPPAVIATGGSAIYYDKAMQQLKKNGICVWLSLPFEEVNRRIGNLYTRGIAMETGMTLEDVYNERLPLYEKYADLRVDSAGSPEATADLIMQGLKGLIQE